VIKYIEVGAMPFRVQAELPRRERFGTIYISAFWMPEFSIRR
jgi:hypothetical protein